MDKLVWLFKSAASDYNIEDVYALLVAVLPTFIALAEMNHSLLEATEDREALEALEALESFYINFKAGAQNLYTVLHRWGHYETLQKLLLYEYKDQVRNELERVLKQLEKRFLSWNGKNARVCKSLGLQPKEGEIYPKLRALRRILPQDDILDEDSVNALTDIIRIDNSSSSKRQQLLDSLQLAFAILDDSQLSSAENSSSCTIKFEHYPLQHIKGLTKKLFEVLSRNWPCRCPSTPHLPQCPGASHISRKTRLNLTQHQRFETVPRHGQTLPRNQALFRILFPTDTPYDHWQDTEIIIHSRESQYAESEEVTRGLYEILRNVSAGIRPKVAIFSNKLWHLRADPERNSSCPPQVQDSEFKSLKELLEPNQRKSQPALSSTERKDRLILSFILTTSLLHFVNGPWLQASLSSENICFLVSHSRSTLDITKPYLTANCASPGSKTESRDLNQAHRFPDILSLGILLLEIARGCPINFEKNYDRCHSALLCFDKWKSTFSHSIIATDGLYQAIRACIEPTEFSGNHFATVTPVNDFEIREYIFQRILFPLGEELSQGYDISLNTLHDDIAMEKKPTSAGSFDHVDEYQAYKQQAAEEWKEHLASVHDLVYFYMERCEKMSNRDKDSTRVKIAMLDTGLQLHESLQANYEAEGRISVKASESFLPSTQEATDSNWKIDCDGHGSRVGQIILEVAPGADLHVARVFKRGSDLANPDMAAQVYKSVVEAIDRATNEWRVDMIIMCFGFDSPIPLIHDAIIKATRVEKPPLFFAATQNDGAHKSMAWPARSASVIGISSTTGDGSRSTFNPSANGAHPILYAFGEGVPVQVEALSEPQGYITQYVSGTSYATPVAAGLAANLLGCVRMVVKASPDEDQRTYENLPRRLQEMDGMLAVLKHHMCKTSDNNLKSLLPWSFLTPSRLANNKLLEEISETLQHY